MMKWKLSDLASVLYSTRGDILSTIVYDSGANIDLEDGCSIEYAIEHYGDKAVQRISVFNGKLVVTI